MLVNAVECAVYWECRNLTEDATNDVARQYAHLMWPQPDAAAVFVAARSQVRCGDGSAAPQHLQG
jgi:hypothetical protein